MRQENPIVGEFISLKSRAETLIRSASLEDISSEISETTRRIAQLPDSIQKVRSRGYRFASYLEHKAEVLQQVWDDARSQAQRLLDTEGMRLKMDLRPLQERLTAGEGYLKNPATLTNVMNDIKAKVDSLENAVNDASRRVKAIYETAARDIAQTFEQLTTIGWYLDQQDEASFPFLDGESLFLAAKAEFVATGKGKDDPDGILYLTDQRLIFEQKETTGKKLGLFGGKKTQELEWEIPLNQIEQVVAENKGLFGGKDMLNFTLGSGAPFAALTVEVKGGVKSKFWAAQIERMIRDAASDERMIQPDEETIQEARKAPTACFSCGGTLPQLVANQHRLECPYCGAVVEV